MDLQTLATTLLRKQFLPKGIPGMLVPGNLDISKQPMVHNPDGSVSNIRSMNFSRDGKSILVPTVHPDGYIMSNQEAIRQYDKTGKHLGIFNDDDLAAQHGEYLHNIEAAKLGLQ